MRKYLIPIILLVLIGIIGFSIYLANHLKNQMRQFKAELPKFRNEYLYDSLANIYSGIFDSSTITNSNHFVTHGSRKTNPVSTFTYDNKFEILIFKLNVTTANSNIIKDIREEKGSARESNGINYRVCELQNLQFWYREVYSENLQEIILCVENSTQIKQLQKSDSIAYYHIPNGKFSLRFGTDSIVTLCSQIEEVAFFTKAQPTNLLLFKTEKNLYLLLAMTTDKSSLPEDILIRCLNKNVIN